MREADLAPAGVEAAAYRQVMRRHAGAVAIVTAGRPGARTGLTATAVCSLSDAPPLVLACVNRGASGHPAIRAAGAFCVNLLACHQAELASLFAGRGGRQGEARFAEASWTTLATGAPVLQGALANLDCTLLDEHAYATHSIFVGQVQGLLLQDGAAPLLYFDGAFRGLSAT